MNKARKRAAQHSQFYTTQEEADKVRIFDGKDSNKSIEEMEWWPKQYQIVD